MLSFILCPILQVHPQFLADEEALDYIESLLVKLLAMMTAKPAPSSVLDIEVCMIEALVTDMMMSSNCFMCHQTIHYHTICFLKQLSCAHFPPQSVL